MDATNPAFTETDAPVVVVASDASMSVVAVPTGQSAKPVVMGFMDAMCRGARPLPRTDLPPLMQQAADLDAILSAQIARNLAEAQARKAAALEAGDRELAHACRIAIARAENNGRAA